MTFNVWYGGAQVDFDRVGTAPSARPARTWSGSRSRRGTCGRIADAAGMAYVDETLHLISRYPIYAVERGGVRFGYLAVGPGRVVAIGNVHLPSSPYGPELVRDGESPRGGAEERARHAARRDPAVPRAARAAGARRRPDLPHRRLQLAVAPRLDARAAAARPQVKYPLRWPVSAALERAGFRDSYREIFPDPVARPGLTWTAGTPPPRIRARETLDRIDWVTSIAAGHDAREPARRRARRAGRGRGRAVGLGSPRGGVDLRRAAGGGAGARPCRAARGAPRQPGDHSLHRRARAREAHRHHARAQASPDRLAADRRHLGPPRGFLRDGRIAAPASTARRVLSHGRVLASSRFWVLGTARAARHPNVAAGVQAAATRSGCAGAGCRATRFDWVGIFRARKTARPVRLPRLQLPRRAAERPHRR